MIDNNQEQQQTPAAPRLYYIDWLRMFAVLLLVPFHTGCIFARWGYHIKNAVRSDFITDFDTFIGMWHMPLLFVLSGAGTWFALGHRGAKGYVWERTKRLFIPLVFGILVIIPPQTYLERLSTGRFQGSYLAFYPYFFEGIYPVGNFTWNHLWFMAYLFVFSLLLLPLTRRLRGPAAQNARARMAAFLLRPGRILLLALPLMLAEALLRVTWNGDQNLIADWANFAFYITSFFWGYLLCMDERISDAILRQRRIFLVLGVICVAIFKMLTVTGLQPAWGYNPGNMAFLALRGFNTWCWVLALFGYGRRYLEFTNRVLDYATEALLPFYILHQTVIIIIGYYVVSWDAGIPFKFWFICITALAGTVAVYEIAVRRIPPMRFLFGMKLRRK